MAKKPTSTAAPDAGPTTDSKPAAWQPSARQIADVIFASRGLWNAAKAKQMLSVKPDDITAEEWVKKTIAEAEQAVAAEDAKATPKA